MTTELAGTIALCLCTRKPPAIAELSAGTGRIVLRLLVPPSVKATLSRRQGVKASLERSLAARHGLPTMWNARVETEAGPDELRCKSSRCLCFHCSRRSRQRLLFRFWREVGCPKCSVLTVEDNGNLPA